MTPLGRTVWAGFYYDAQHAGRHPVTITIATDGLHIRKEDRTVFWWSYRDIRQTQGSHRHEHARLEKGADSAEALVVTEDGFLQAIRQVAPEIGGRFARRETVFGQLRWLLVLGGGSIALLAGLYLWGIPGLADFAARRVPVSWEENLGVRTVEAIAPSQKRCEDPERISALEGIISRLAPSGRIAPYSIHLTVVNEEAVNALAAPGGYVVVYRGLLDKTARAEELAGVLAHEIEHIRQRHGTRAMFRHLSTGALFSMLAGDSGGLASALEAVGTLGELRYSRQDEEAADRGGLMLIQNARIDPKGMLRFLESLQEERSAESGFPAYLSTHPPTQERVERLRRMSAEAAYAPLPLALEYSWEEVKRICEGSADR